MSNEEESLDFIEDKIATLVYEAQQILEIYCSQCIWEQPLLFHQSPSELLVIFVSSFHWLQVSIFHCLVQQVFAFQPTFPQELVEARQSYYLRSSLEWQWFAPGCYA